VAAPTLSESWTRLDGSWIHAWHASATDDETAGAQTLVVMLPGLGLPAYATPTVRAVADRGASCVLLDLPGFGETGPLDARPHIHDIGNTAARWIDRANHGGRLVIVGHSTGAQAALTAALAVQSDRPDAELVLAGPTFMPAHRRLGPLLRSTPRAYREDSLRELRVLPAVARGRLRVWRILRSGMSDAPERRIARLRLGVTLTAGRADAFSPPPWLRMLRDSARLAAHAEVVEAPGSHNNLFTHPDDLADIILGGGLPPTTVKPLTPLVR
jgi:pimeloyl-ACP methyl ester carboxylesterase